MKNEKVSNKTFEDIVKPYIEASKKEEEFKKELIKEITELKIQYMVMTAVIGDPILAAVLLFSMI